MAELIIGFIFMFVGVLTSFAVVVTGNSSAVVFTGLFVIAGALVFIKGFKQKQKDKKTDINGEICFGRLKETKNNGTYVNGRAYQDAYIYTFIPSLETVKLMKENIGGNYTDYVPGVYLQLKYYEGDINIVGFVKREEVPQNALNELDKINDIISNYTYTTTSSNTPLQPMDMPSNGVSYSWNNDNNNNNQN